MNDNAIEPETLQISDEIAHALHKSWFFDRNTIGVTEENGKVTLTGEVATTHDRRRAAIAAWSHPGVINVINDIVVV